MIKIYSKKFNAHIELDDTSEAIELLKKLGNIEKRNYNRPAAKKRYKQKKTRQLWTEQEDKIVVDLVLRDLKPGTIAKNSELRKRHSYKAIFKRATMVSRQDFREFNRERRKLIKQLLYGNTL